MASNWGGGSDTNYILQNTIQKTTYDTIHLLPSIDISCSEMLSFSIALTCLYRWNRYGAFGTDIVRNLAEASLAFIFAVFRFASPAHCIDSVAREMLII